MTTESIVMPLDSPSPPPAKPDSSPSLPDLRTVFQDNLDLASLPPPARRRNPGWLYLSFGVMALVALAGWYWWPRSTNGANDVLGAVTRGDLDVTVLDWGELESAKSVEVRCEVEGQRIKIIEIVPEGSAVKKDQVVVRFDTEELTKAFQDQEIKLKQAEGKALASEEELKVTINKAEGDVEKAKIAKIIAELDRDKYLDPQGDFQAKINEAKGKVAQATKGLEEATEKLENYRKFVKKGFGTPESLRQREAELEYSKHNLDSLKASLFVLENFDFRKHKAEYESKASDAKREVYRAESTGKASVEKAKSELEAAQVTAKLERRALERIKKQLDACVIKAPQDGIVVYDRARYWDPESGIRPGGMAHYQQVIFKLPDLSQMKVKAKVHESQVKKVQKGQKVEIMVSSLANQVIRGTVQTVATLADSRGPWDERGVKEYITEVSIDELPANAGLKPGMTAEVRIHCGTHKNVLMVPVAAVSERDGKHFAYLYAGNYDKREVTVGESNEKFIIIKDGLKEGDQVALNTRKRLIEEAKKTEDLAPGKEKQPTAPLSPGKSQLAANPSPTKE
jgi:RND family efflux transporter MFP subunit